VTTQLISAVIVSLTSAAVLALARLLSGRAHRAWTTRKSGVRKRRAWLAYASVLVGGAGVGYVVGIGIDGQEARGRIVSPESGAVVPPGRLAVSGTLEAIPGDRHVWIVAQRDNSLFPKEEVGSHDARWTRSVSEAGPPHGFALVLLLVDDEGHRAIERWLARGARFGSFPAFTRPGGSRQLDSVDVVQRTPAPTTAEPSRPTGLITSPRTGARVRVGLVTVRGRLGGIPRGRHVWVALKRGSWLFPKEPEIGSRNARWTRQIDETGPPHDFSLVLLMVARRGHVDIVRWLERGKRSGNFPALTRIRDSRRLDAVALHQR